MTSRILVTGGAGFIGSHLVEALLARGDAVAILDDFNDFYDPRRKERNLEAVRARIVLERSDLCDADLDELLNRNQVDRVVHLAARAGVRPSVADPGLYHRVNVTGTLRLLESCRRAGVKRFVFGSSSSVYGARTIAPFREDDVLSPESPYAATKLAGEYYTGLYARLHGLPSVILRFFTVYGPRQRPDMAIHAFARSILEGRPLAVYGDGSARRDFTYVDDIVRGIVSALDPARGVGDGPPIYNLGNESPVSVSDLIRRLEAATGRRAVVDRRPAAPGDVPLTCADLTAARRDLGYAPQVLLADGLRRFVEWLNKDPSLRSG